jgi:hypothetical protein
MQQVHSGSLGLATMLLSPDEMCQMQTNVLHTLANGKEVTHSDKLSTAA